jgi:hypothetical protein
MTISITNQSLRFTGLSLSRICAVLNSEAVPTPGGASLWRKATVDRLLHALWVRDLDSGDQGAAPGSLASSRPGGRRSYATQWAGPQ